MGNTTTSLWGEEFEIAETLEKTKKIVSKIKEEKLVSLDVDKALKSKKVSLEEKISLIKDNVLNILHKQLDNVETIYSREKLHDYLIKGLRAGRIAIDTETNNSLDPITCKLMGLCLYVKGEKQAYVPINHVDKNTGERLSKQLTEHDIQEELQWLVANKGSCKFVFHNGKFDYKVIKCTCGVALPIDWDTMIAARLLNENEPAGLKEQYVNKIDPEQTKYDIEHLFNKIPYEIFEPELFALYAATDAMMTDKLYEWQINTFRNPELKGIYRTLTNIEIPVSRVVAEMELRGVCIDEDYGKRLSVKYHNKIEDCDRRIQEEMSKYEGQLEKYLKERGGTTKIKSPINLDSPLQLSEFLYDVLGLPQVNIKNPRGTGVDELTRLNEKVHLPLCNLILEKRNLSKLLNTFIDKLLEVLNPKDRKIHCNFNGVGTDTGRFASRDPNLQNIPAHNKEVRMLFKASPGFKLVGADYSAQEVRMAAFISKDNDMINAYKQGKDLYSVIASAMYKNAYEDNLEFYPAGTKILYEGKEVTCGDKTHTNPEGKARRQSAKSVLIGSLYGRGAASIAEQLNELRSPGDKEITIKDAQDIMDRFYRGFPTVKKWMEDSIKFAHKYGYIDDWYGRRRHLPDIMLPRYEIVDKRKDEEKFKFNPLLECESRKIENPYVKELQKDLEKIQSKRELNNLKKKAQEREIDIVDNSGLISQAERQSINFQTQGGGASLTKLAMININNDLLLNRLDFHLLLTVHDEVIGECPEENAEEAAKRLSQIMINTAKDNNITVPMKCDATIATHWYEDEMEAVLNNEFSHLMREKNMSSENALNHIKQEHSELTEEYIEKILLSK